MVCFVYCIPQISMCPSGAGLQLDPLIRYGPWAGELQKYLPIQGPHQVAQKLMTRSFFESLLTNRLIPSREMTRETTKVKVITMSFNLYMSVSFKKESEKSGSDAVEIISKITK